MTFINKTDKTLEGELKFNLNEGVTVTSYGLDVEGDMVDAVPVTKEKARVVFETEVRERSTNQVAIVEQVKGNVFKTRLYPIHGKQERKIKIQTIEEMKSIKKTDKYDIEGHWQPIQRPTTIEKMEINIKIEEQLKTKITIADNTNVHKKINKRTINLKDIDEMLAETKEGELGGIYICTATELKETRIVQAKTHMAIEIEKNMRKEKEEKEDEQKKIVVYIDQSHSRTKEAIQEEHLILKEIEEKGNQLHIYPFNQHVAKTKIEVNDISTIRFDGGTSIENVIDHMNEQTKTENYDYAILLTDGFETIGENIYEKTPAIPIYSISAEKTQNHALLTFIGNKSGGGYYNATKMSKISQHIGKQEYSLLQVRAPEGVECYPSIPEKIQGKITLYAKSTLKEAFDIEVDIGYPNDKETLKFHMTPTEDDSELIAKLFAQRKIDQLGIFGEKYDEELLETGREYKIITPNTSLIVLETLEQYKKYDIRPPASLPHLRKEFDEEQHQVKKKEQEAFDAKVKRICEQFKSQRYESWYTHTFELKPKSPKTNSRKKKGRRGGLLSSIRSILPSSSSSSSSQPSSSAAAVIDVAEERIETLENQSETLDGFMSMNNKCCDIEEVCDEEICDEDDELCIEPAMDQDMREVSDKVAEKEGGKKSSQPVASTIQIQPYDSKAEYMVILKKSEDPFEAYLEQKQNYHTSPSFYLEVAGYFMDQKQYEKGITVLLNITELNLEDPELLRIVGYRLFEAKAYTLACQIFRQVLSVRPESPQSYRDLALVLECLNEFEEAATTMYQVIGRQWDSRFAEIEYTAILELNHILFSSKRAKKEITFKSLDIDSCCRYEMPMDLRVSMTWSADEVDIDLHVIEPTKEECYYGHNLTRIGGKLSRDFTRGCGPEEYMLKKKIQGKFDVSAKYFANHQQSLTGGTTVLLTFYKYYMQENEERAMVTRPLSGNKEKLHVCSIPFS
eukprot:CAMPEP_0117429500 /NCGR_PEP_ID=MMETSP0758-20121206/9054_1 /TAXON_ID=63605 /ORGANISM="Percolomonas cosmopolitus, Strain AE-1 (ATCC 50343)" /LENGTH=963 /DNA_ID=CAMNT_0005216611 /DNA_START=174 /DNA_END=3065 /DNA_ORIENTATION=-